MCARAIRGIARREPFSESSGATAHTPNFCICRAINLLEVPDKVSDEEAVFVEPLAAAFGITEQVEISPETRVAVIGDGKLGIFALNPSS